MASQQTSQPAGSEASSSEDDVESLRARVAELEEELEIRKRHLELATDGFWDWDLKTDYEYMSPRFWETFGYDPQDFPHHASAWQDMIHPEDGAAALKLFEEHTREGKDYRLPVRYRHKDGHWVWVVCRGKALKNKAGEYCRMLGAHQDITELKRQEEALEQATRQFSDTFLHAPIGIALVSPEGRWLRVNRALCDIVGYTEEELLQATFQDITHPDDLDLDLQYVEQMLRGEIQTYQMDKRYVQRDGRVIWVQLNVSLLRDSEGAPVHFISQIQDITEAREHLERVESLNTELRELLDTFSHDLSEPVRKLAVHAARMREAIRKRDPDRALRSIEILQTESDRLGNIHDGLMQYLRYATLPLRRERVDLQALIAHQSSRLRPRIEALAATVEVAPLPAVYVDRGMLSATLHNLLDNALKYHRPRERPHIRVYAEASPERKLVTLCIRDNGVGIEESHIARALHIFRGVDGRSSEADPGVGLAICRKIVERHGGALRLCPNGDEPGLTVTLTLPALKPAVPGPVSR